MFIMNLWRYAVKSESREVLFIAKNTSEITLQHARLGGTIGKLEIRQYTSLWCL